MYEGGVKDDEYVNHLYNDVSRKSLHLDLKMKQYTYGADGVEKMNTTLHPMHLCTEDYFTTKFEKEFFELYKKNHVLCADYDHLFL